MSAKLIWIHIRSKNHLTKNITKHKPAIRPTALHVFYRNILLSIMIAEDPKDRMNNIVYFLQMVQGYNMDGLFPTRVFYWK